MFGQQPLAQRRSRRGCAPRRPRRARQHSVSSSIERLLRFALPITRHSSSAIASLLWTFTHASPAVDVRIQQAVAAEAVRRHERRVQPRAQHAHRRFLQPAALHARRDDVTSGPCASARRADNVSRTTAAVKYWFSTYRCRRAARIVSSTSARTCRTGSRPSWRGAVQAMPSRTSRTSTRVSGGHGSSSSGRSRWRCARIAIGRRTPAASAPAPARRSRPPRRRRTSPARRETARTACRLRRGDAGRRPRAPVCPSARVSGRGRRRTRAGRRSRPASGDGTRRADAPSSRNTMPRWAPAGAIHGGQSRSSA